MLLPAATHSPAISPTLVQGIAPKVQQERIMNALQCCTATCSTAITQCTCWQQLYVTKCPGRFRALPS